MLWDTCSVTIAFFLPAASESRLDYIRLLYISPHQERQSYPVRLPSSKQNGALRRNSGKPSNIDDSVRWLFWVHSAVDAQRMDCDSVVAGVPGVSARTGRRGEDAETVGAAQA